jgi:hypothetical protein
MDPDKRSVTIEVMGGDETVRGGGRFATDHTGYRALLHYAKQWPGRVWAIEGCRGIGHHVAVRLLSEGEEVVDVPPKLSARTRVCATGQGRKTGTTDANSLGWVGTRMAGFAGGGRRAARGAAGPGRPTPLAGRGPVPQSDSGVEGRRRCAHLRCHPMRQMSAPGVLRKAWRGGHQEIRRKRRRP